VVEALRFCLDAIYSRSSRIQTSAAAADPNDISCRNVSICQVQNAHSSAGAL
jgi:hypothetical protein